MRSQLPGVIASNVVCALLAACSGGTSSTSATSGTSGTRILAATTSLGSSAPAEIPEQPGPASAQAVKVSCLMRHVLNGQLVLGMPFPASDFGAQAMAEQAGTWTTYPGQPQTGETMFIPGVPAGFYDLEVTQATSYYSGLVLPQFFVTSSRGADFGSMILGRADVVPPAAGTMLALDLKGLEPFDPNGDVQLVSAGAGIGYSSLPSLATPSLSTGATHFQASIDYVGLASALSGSPSAPGAGLIDARQGDEVYVSELSAEVADGSAGYLSTGAWGLTRSSTVPNVVVANAASTPLSATLRPVSQTAFVPTIHPAPYMDLAERVNPQATVAGYWGHVDTLPLGANEQYWGGYADLLIHIEGPVSEDTPLALSFGNPYPSSWPVVANFWALYLTQWSVPSDDGGAAVAYLQFNSVGGVDSLKDMLARGLLPEVDPVVSPTLDGKSLFADIQGGLSAAPRVAWTAAQGSEATSYLVVLTQLDASAGNVTSTEVAELTTEQSWLDVPPGMLVHGSHYIVQITANYAPGSDPSEHPFAPPFFPAYSADVVSGLITP